MDNKVKQLRAELIDWELEHIINIIKHIPDKDWQQVLEERRREWETLSANDMLDNTEHADAIARLRRQIDILEKLIEVREICK